MDPADHAVGPGVKFGEPGEDGFVTLQHLLAAAVAMVFFVVLANLAVMQYSLGVVTAGLDEAVRQGARSVDPVGACEVRLVATTSSALSGGALNSAGHGCRLEGGWVVASFRGDLAGWAPLVPNVGVEREARAPLETQP